MNAETATCPYCNTPLPAAPVAGQRLSCPRCGETVPYRASESVQSAPSSDSAVPSLAPAVTLAPPSAPAWSNRRLAFTVLGTMIGMALVGLTFALLTIKSRRDHDPKPPPPPPPPLLGYLPGDSQLVLSINVVEALRTPAGNAFLDHTEISNLGFHFDTVEKVIGLKRDNLEQVVISSRTDDVGRIVLLARTRRPYNVKQVRDTLKAEVSTDVGKKKAYHFSVDNWDALLWPADDWTVVVALSQQALKAVPDAPGPEANGLPAVLQNARKDHLRPGAQVWLAGTIDNWEAARFFLSKRLSKEDLDALTAVRTFAFGLHLGEDVKLDAAFQTTDDASAEALQKLLGKATNTGYLKVLGSHKGGEKVAAELAKSLTDKRDGTWVTLEGSASVESVKEAGK